MSSCRKWVWLVMAIAGVTPARAADANADVEITAIEMTYMPERITF